MLIRYPNSNLNLKSNDVEEINFNIISLFYVMEKEMMLKNGVGISAPQLNVQYRCIIVSNSDGNKIKMVNPKIISFSKEKIISNEGCLSLPDIVRNVPRKKNIIVEYKDLEWNTCRLVVDNDLLLSCCIQHEIDHLNGKLIIDY